MTERIVLVTGASSGSGRAIAARMARNGYRVFGTSRNPKSDTLDGFEMLKLDVTDDDSAAACVQAVIDRAGRIDVLVNNAGVELIGAAEEISIEEAKALFETNYFGVLRMVSVVLPAMRERGDGLIINISSVAGFASGPCQSAYAASKHALEAYSEALHYEMQVGGFGVRIALVEPGIFNSGLTGDRQVRPQNTIAAYDDMRETIIRTFGGYIERGRPADDIAQLVLKVADGKTRRLRHIITTLDLRFNTMAKFAPEWAVSFIARTWFGVSPWPFLRNRAK